MEEKISSLLEDRFAEEDLKECFLVDIKLGINNKLEVFIDGDNGINFKKCQIISRYLESHIESENWLGEKYILEVSSPGVSRPLVMSRQYPKHIGRQMVVTMLEGKKEEGILTKISDAGIILQKKERIKIGKKKQTIISDVEIRFDEIEQSIVKISFKKIK